MCSRIVLCYYMVVHTVRVIQHEGRGQEAACSITRVLYYAYSIYENNHVITCERAFTGRARVLGDGFCRGCRASGCIARLLRGIDAVQHNPAFDLECYTCMVLLTFSS